MSSLPLWLHFERLLSNWLLATFSSNISFKDQHLQPPWLYHFFCWTVRPHVSWSWLWCELLSFQQLFLFLSDFCSLAAVLQQTPLHIPLLPKGDFRKVSSFSKVSSYYYINMSAYPRHNSVVLPGSHSA